MKALSPPTPPSISISGDPKQDTVLLHFQSYRQNHSPKKPSQTLKERDGGVILHHMKCKQQLGLRHEKENILLE